jgi:hypothetical protein
MLTIKPVTVCGASFFNVMMGEECMFTFTSRNDARKAIAYLNATEGY